MRGSRNAGLLPAEVREGSRLRLADDTEQTWLESMGYARIGRRSLWCG